MTRVRRGPSPARDTIALAGHVLAVVGGGYACTAAAVALAARALPLAFGMARSEAAVLTAMAGFVLYLALLVWGFAEPRQGRVWAVLLGGAALCLGGVQWLVLQSAA
jgi:hypothetical protein